MVTILRLMAMLAAVLILPATGSAESMADRALVDALRAGGHVLYFRHAATDWSRNDQVGKDGDWTSCDPDRMRQLSDEGRAAARRIGEAIRALGIPVKRVLSSQYCRSAETARQMAFGPVETTRDIMNLRSAEYVGGVGVATANARRVFATPPPAGGNTVVVGHGNLMRAATGAYTGEGGSVILRPAPGSEWGFTVIAELADEDWTRLAGRFAE